MGHTMCDDPTHDPKPVAAIVKLSPGINSTKLYAALYEVGVENQATRIALAVEHGLITRKRVGKAYLHYPKGSA
jgi:hypothetical protein